jgi:hypothetical protein
VQHRGAREESEEDKVVDSWLDKRAETKGRKEERNAVQELKIEGERDWMVDQRCLVSKLA